MKNITIEVRLLAYTAVTDTIGVMTFAAQYPENFRVVKDAWCVRAVVVKDGALGSDYIVCYCGTAELRPMISKTETHLGIDTDARAALALVRSM